MRSKWLWTGVALALLMALALGTGGEAQPPGKKKGFGKRGGFRAGVTVDQIVERILSFDKNNDGKITLDELPERMQHLIALGDTNKDGALDKEEIRKLAVTLESLVGLANPGGRGGFLAALGDRPPRPAGGPRGREIQRTLDELELKGKTRDRAELLLRAHEDKLRTFEQANRAELVSQMKDVLNEKDYQAFKSALERLPAPPPFAGPRPPDLERRIDQLQKEVDDLRRKQQK
jgi:EF hand